MLERSLRDRAAASAGELIQLKREAALTDDQPPNQDLKEVRRILKSHRAETPSATRRMTASRSASLRSLRRGRFPGAGSQRPQSEPDGKRAPHGRSRARSQAGRAGGKGSRNRRGTSRARGSRSRERDESIPSLPCPLCRLRSTASGLWGPPAAARGITWPRSPGSRGGKPQGSKLTGVRPTPKRK